MRDLEARARREANDFLTRAEEIAPADPRLVEYLFERAALAQDWEAVEQVGCRAAPQTNRALRTDLEIALVVLLGLKLTDPVAPKVASD